MQTKTTNIIALMAKHDNTKYRYSFCKPSTVGPRIKANAPKNVIEYTYPNIINGAPNLLKIII